MRARPSLPVRFSTLFVRRSSRAGRRGSARRDFRRTAAPSGEALEPRRMLAFQYQGFTHTAASTIPRTQAYQYNFEVFQSGPGDSASMFMRNVNNTGSLEFGYDTAFNSLTNLGSGLFINNGTGLPAPAAPGFEGPVRLVNANAFSASFNTAPPQVETFVLAKVRVAARPGTVNPTFVLHVGDAMPLALEVDFSQASGTSSIIIRSSATQSLAGDVPVGNLPNGGGGYRFLASEIRIQAAVTPAQGGNEYRATNLIRIENAVAGGLNAKVASGNFEVIAGASVGGALNITTGGGVPPSAQAFAAYGTGGNGGDILIDGAINSGSSVVLQTFSVDPRIIRTGPSGFIQGTSSITLNNAGADGGLIDVETRDFAQHNIFAGSASSQAADIGIEIRQTAGDLTLNALPASRGKIDLQAPDGSVVVNANVDTIGALALTAATLNVTRPLSTERGDISLTGDSVTLGSNVTAGTSGVGDIRIAARAGSVNVTSAAVVQAPGDAITISATGDVTSQATLVAERLSLTAGQALDVRSRADSLSVQAGGKVTVAEFDGLVVERLVTTAAGDVSLTAEGLLDLVDVATGGSGAITATTTAAGLIARDLRTQAGAISLSASSGDIEARGDVFVTGTDNDLTLAAATGSIVISPTAIFTVADELVFQAPAGRVLTPGTISSVSVTNAGSGYTSAPSVSLQAGTGAVGTPLVGAGQVTAVRMTQGGSGYVTAPAVVFGNAGTGGAGAVATAILQNGVVVGVNITSGGSGYTLPPTISFTGGGGSGATAEASINGLTAINVSSPGTGYQVPPSVVISAGDGGSSAAVSVDGFGAIRGVSLSQPGRSYNAPPTVVITDTSGSGFGATATAIVSNGVSGGVVTAGGAGYPATTTATVSEGGGTGAIGLPLLGLTNASLTVPGGGTGTVYRIGDLLTVVSGNGARIGVATVGAGGTVTAVEVLGGGRDYSLGDVLYLNDQGLGANGLQARVTAVTTGGVITAMIVDAGGTDYTTAARFLHLGGTGAILRVTGVDGGGAITAAEVERPGSGYTTRATRVVGGSGSGGAIAFNDTSYAVVGYQVVQPGSGYTGLPTITVSGAGGATIQPSLSGVVTGITVGNPGSGYNPATTRIQIVPVASGSGATGHAARVDGLGGITAVNVATPGAGYVAAPRVLIVDRSGSGFGATATASISLGVTAITLTNAGSGYTVAPTVTIRDADGSDRGTKAVASVANGFITGITITEPGSGYTGTPAVTFSSGSASAGATTSNVVTGITITSSGAGYDPLTTEVTLDPIGSGATAVANLTGGTVTSIKITDNGSGYSTTALPTVGLVPYGSGALASATLSGGGVGSVTVTAPGASYAVPPVVTFAAPGGGGTTATGVAAVGSVAQLSAARLNWTALEQPLSALLDQFAVAKIVLTGVGDLDVTRASGDLVLEGAQTKDGSIRVAAQSLKVTGPVVAGDFNTSRTENAVLVALGGDLTIAAAVTAPATVTLEAQSGKIAGTATDIVTAKDLVISALTGVTLRTAVETARGGVTGNAAPLTITESNAITLGTGTAGGQTLFATNGAISVTTLDGSLSVQRVDAGVTGSVTLAAALNLVEATASPGSAEVIAGSATLSTTSGRVDLDTAVQSLQASAPLSTVTIDNLGAVLLSVVSATARDNVSLSATAPLEVIMAESTLNNVLVTTSGSVSSLVVGNISAPIGAVTLDSAQNIGHGTLAGVVAATGARVRAVGSATLRTTVGTLGATAGTGVTITETDAITLGETGGGVPPEFARVQSTTGTVSVTAGGLISALDVAAPQGDVSLVTSTAAIAVGAIVAGTTSGVVTLTAGQSITDNDAAIDITAFRAVLSSSAGSIGAASDPLDLKVGQLSATATAGTIDIAETDALVITGITTTSAALAAGGPITQTGTIAAPTLSIRTTAPLATVSLVAPANNVGTLSGGTNTGTFRFVNAGSLTVGAPGITTGTAEAGDGDIELTSENGGLTIVSNLTAKNDVVVLNAVNGTIVQQAGSMIDAGVLRWNARSAAFNGTIPAAVIPPPPPGEVQIGPTVPGQTLVVVGGSYTGNVVIVNSGDIRIDGVVTATGTITVTSQTGAVRFGGAGRLDATSVSLAAINDSQLVVGDGVPLSAAVSAGSLALSSPGSLRQNGAITATALSATAGSGAITLDNQNNSVGGFSASAPHVGGNVVFVNAGGFGVAEPIVAGTATAGDGFVTLSAVTGNISVSALITAPGDLVELRAPAGVVTLGVAPVAQTLIVIDSTGGGVPTGPIEAANLEALLGAIDIVNSLPVSGTVYRIIVTASLTLTRTLTFANAIALEGVPGVVIDGGGTLGQGVVIGSLAAGSRITNLAFANFTGAAVTVNAARNVAIQGLTVSNSATGLALSGVLTGTTVRGSTFRSVRVAMQLTGAQGATIGGTPTAQRNRIEGATQAGVVATGFCTGTRIVGTTFTTNPRTRTQFNVRNSRGLRISGTSVEKPPRTAGPVARGRSPISVLGR